MKIVTVAQMKEIESRAASVGLPSEVLMDRAGLAVAEEVKRLVERPAGRRILVLVGPGNNGGDGLVAARHLDEAGADVYLYLCGRDVEGDRNFRLAQEHNIPVIIGSQDDNLTALDNLLAFADVVLDAIFGTGKVRPVEGLYKDVLTRVKQARRARSRLTVVALDMPSGLDADNGAIDPACLAADVTITLGYPKLGLYTATGLEVTGRLMVADIGIPDRLAEDVPTELITADWVRSLLPQRPYDAHKGSFGRVMVVAGSINFIGAAYLACQAAMRVGAGLVTLATPRSLQTILASKLTEVTYLPLEESQPGVVAAEATSTLLEQLSGYDVLLLGCGLGQHRSTISFVNSILLAEPAHHLPQIVLDADALNTLARTQGWWQKLSRDAILTPHPGEMSRLTGLTPAEVQSRRLDLCREKANSWHKTVVLKGAYTVVAAPAGQARISALANPGLATAGTGDVLAGSIAGLMAQGLLPLAAAAAGVYLHGAAGDMVRLELGDAGMIASDLLNKLPLVLKELKAG
ncbi:MAG: NAD(P)H-hydrate dehydratase [Chloroflexi bacterium]|nr:NAD(P)H-hydrate dehydratase [Chloroflexota bacterium]